MYNLHLVDAAPLEDYRRVCSHRAPATRSRLKALRPTVEHAYEAYAHAGESIECLSSAPLAEEDKSALSTNFRKLDSGEPCNDIRMSLLGQTQAGQCPYCRLEDATSLDHILEKSRFPEFSVLRSNLAPCCLTCNTTKQHNSSSFRGSAILHLYFNEFPAECLRMQIATASGRPKFEFEIQASPGVSHDRLERVRNHFQSLNLGYRYARRANVEMMDRRQDMQRLHGLGGPVRVAEFLRQSSLSVAANWSRQDWLYVLLATASQDEEFCDRGIFML